jgi:hypothetical protein
LGHCPEDITQQAPSPYRSTAKFIWKIISAALDLAIYWIRRIVVLESDISNMNP